MTQQELMDLVNKLHLSVDALWEVVDYLAEHLAKQTELRQDEIRNKKATSND